MKMKKKILSVAVMAAIGAGSAQAVNLGTDGMGQALLFPYYTVQGDEETLLTVVNTTDRGKAVKIRFREAENSREVLDFNIYLSPQDVWVGKVTDNDAGDGAAVVSPDSTCTYPLSISQGKKEAFRPYAYNGQAGTPPKDSGTQDLTRTREGYVEILEMGVPDDTFPVWDADNDGNPDYWHIGGAGDNTQLPENCGTIANGWSGSSFLLPLNYMNAPTGGLFGELAIINVNTGTEISENATALENLYTTPKHFDTGRTAPTLGDVQPGISQMIHNGVYYNQAFAPGSEIDAVSSVLMAASISNTYTVNPGLFASSAWVVTFPTKSFYADHPAPATMPFTNVFANGQACESIQPVAYDREEYKLIPDDSDFSPRPQQPGVELCYEVNVIQFEESNVLSASNTVMRYKNLPGKNGWLDLRLDNLATRTITSAASVSPAGLNGVVYRGLPVIGFSVSELLNNNVGVGAAYATSNSHVYRRVVSGI